MMATLLRTALLGGVITGFHSFDALAQSAETPRAPLSIERAVSELHQVNQKSPNLFLKLVTVTREEERSLIDMIRGLPNTETDTGIKIIRVGRRDHKSPGKLVPSAAIGAVTTECVLLPRDANQMSPIVARSREHLKDIDTRNPIQIYDPEEQRREQNQGVANEEETPTPIGARQEDQLFKAALALRFISNKSLCQKENTYERCLDWDKNQNRSLAPTILNAFISSESASKALIECKRADQELHAALSKGKWKRIRLQSFPNSNQVVSPTFENLTRPVPMGFTELNHSWSKDSLFDLVDRVVTCETRKSPARPDADSLGTVSFTFESKYQDLPPNPLPLLGNLSNIRTMAGRAGELPYLDFNRSEQLPDSPIEMKAFQYFPLNPTLFAFNKETSVVRQMAVMPLAIDVLFFEKSSRNLHRTVFDFQLKKVIQQEFYQLPFENLTALVGSSFWNQEIKNWLTPTSEAHIRPDGAQIISCD